MLALGIYTLLTIVDAAVPPWVGAANEDELKSHILKLSAVCAHAATMPYPSSTIVGLGRAEFCPGSTPRGTHLPVQL